MVEFSLKKSNDTAPGPKKLQFGGFSLKNKNAAGGLKQKQKPLVKSKIGTEEEDDSVRKISITSSEDLKPKQPEEIVIALKPNKSLIQAKQQLARDNTTEQGQGQGLGQDNKNEKLTYGLNVISKRKIDDADETTQEGSTIKEKTMTEQARDSILRGESSTHTGVQVILKSTDRTTNKRSGTDEATEQDEDDDHVPDYSKISVDDFGLAFLKGLGYKPEDEQKTQDNTTKNKRQKLYGGQKGLGSK